MITIKTNIGQAVQVTIKKLEKLEDMDKLNRVIATSVLGMMKTRIHEKGLNAENKQIGTYSKGYMVIRTGSFVNAKRVSRGANKGRLKDAGVFTDRTIRLSKRVRVFIGEDKVEKGRPKYNRTSDNKVIASLTRQMENDMKVIAIKSGSYGIGYTNALNYNKSQWVEKTYKQEGRIFSLSPDEVEAVTNIANQYVKDALS
ncbi:hypothetical protein [Segetibacter aerophilus]|uniref:Virion morphogenesis protein n=1 Tax=Segetibacter aerophilus TaxID=670293 RepID=A0A512BA09_9BACT|nr:hypothetical protein [Segetibacter aerophilus]GEO08773.1 hypothetical protein SAE01_12690 [Segetibacter aerophilus]